MMANGWLMVIKWFMMVKNGWWSGWLVGWSLVDSSFAACIFGCLSGWPLNTAIHDPSLHTYRGRERERDQVEYLIARGCCAHCWTHHTNVHIWKYILCVYLFYCSVYDICRIKIYISLISTDMFPGFPVSIQQPWGCQAGNSTTMKIK